MARRRRTRRKRTNNVLVIVQIAVLGITLAVILLFRGSIGEVGSTFMDAFGGREDVDVRQPNSAQEESSSSSAP